MSELADYVDAWLDAIRDTRYRELGELQNPPYANLSHGAVGTAYALWRLGDKRRAKTWLAAAKADRRRAALSDGTNRPSACSMMFGRAGIAWVHAAITGETAPFARWLRAGADKPEVASGTAGLVIGAVRLGIDPADRVEQLADATRARCARPWTPNDALGFAHHWGGILYAQLAWHELAGHAVTRQLADAIASLAEVSPDGSPLQGPLRASWCNGFAGITLLWCKAYELLGGDAVRDAAIRSATAACDLSGTQPSLCCGDAGIAYACLATARIDPTNAAAWRARAERLAAGTIGSRLVGPAGLYQGHPGLVLLARVFTAGDADGFPAIAS